MAHRRIVFALLVVTAISAVTLGARAATPEGSCATEAEYVIGWGGSRFVPVPPQGIGASCVFHSSGSTLLGGDVSGYFLAGGMQMILPDGRRFYCRDAYSETPFYLAGTKLGQQYPGLRCYINLVGQVEMRLSLPQPVFGDIYCSTTGELGVRVALRCYDF